MITLDPLHDYEQTSSFLPEKNLVSAVLIRAWADISSSDNSIRNDARKWIVSPKTSEFSFRWCCSWLGLSVSFTREKILAVPFYDEVNKLQSERYNKAYCFVAISKIITTRGLDG